MSTMPRQPILAQLMFGVNADIAVAILLAGPQLPCIVPERQAVVRAGGSAITPQAAMTRRKRAG